PSLIENSYLRIPKSFMARKGTGSPGSSLLFSAGLAKESISAAVFYGTAAFTFSTVGQPRRLILMSLSYRIRINIVTQPPPYRLPQTTRLGDAAEFDLSHQVRCHPVGIGTLVCGDVYRCGFARQSIKLLAETAQLMIVKTRADA